MSTNEYANTTECHNTQLSHGVMEEEEEEDAGSEPGACCTCEAAAAAAVKLLAKPSSARAISPDEDFPTAGDAARTRVASSTIVPLSSS